jgi:hypothetical protein
MTALELLRKNDIPYNQTVHHAIARTGDVIDNAGYPLEKANFLIKQLGGQEVDNIVIAKLMAKSLIEQVYIQKDDYKGELAIVVAKAKVDKILHNSPYILQTSEPVSTSAPVSDKKAAARAIFDRMQGSPSGQIAKAIQTELQITYANAYYYVSRVFK